ncbi:MAG TPA: M28 family metallopeptidase [Gemmatimonadaceae bacterium]|nr:M28 family metallopeptidase [Gemmatimonadaceae bacterium]
MTMRINFILSCTAAAIACAPSMPSPVSLPANQIASRYRADADRIIAAALRDSTAYRRVGVLADKFGSRFSGTPQLELAIDWILAAMREDGLDNVHSEPVMVPRWIRGEESLQLVSPRPLRLRMLGLGSSIGTPAAGITAPVLVVSSFDDLKSRAAVARGKIVLYDVPFTTYGQTVQYRTRGASEAARVGAVASLVRTVGPESIQSPHTGNMRYDTTTNRIPAAAISVEDAMMLHRFQNTGEQIVVTLRMGATTGPDAQSRNVVAELRGSERPEEVVVVSGHIDSWDVGQGTMDDAGGAFAAWEAVRLIKQLGLKPRRTLRVVMWTNEENGARGAAAYRDAHRAEVGKHVLAIESDGGTFNPVGFGVNGTTQTVTAAQMISPLLTPIGAGKVNAEPDADTDIAPLVALGVPGMGLRVDGTRYFWYHHSEADTFDKLNAVEVSKCVAALAIMSYVVADMPDALPRGDSTKAR